MATLSTPAMTTGQGEPRHTSLSIYSLPQPGVRMSRNRQSTLVMKKVQLVAQLYLEQGFITCPDVGFDLLCIGSGAAKLHLRTDYCSTRAVC